VERVLKKAQRSGRAKIKLNRSAPAPWSNSKAEIVSALKAAFANNNCQASLPVLTGSYRRRNRHRRKGWRRFLCSRSKSQSGPTERPHPCNRTRIAKRSTDWSGPRCNSRRHVPETC